MSYYHTCSCCGAALDSSECCSCQDEEKATARAATSDSGMGVVWNHSEYIKYWRKCQMNEKKYCRLVTVDTGDGLRTAHLELGITVSPGDMVSLDTDECGIAIAAILVEEGGEEYAFIANLTPFYKATSVYRCVWNREDPNEPA